MATTEKWAKLFKSRHQYADSVPVQFGDAKDAAFNWNGTNLQLLPVTDDVGAFNIGDGTTDFDLKVFLGTANKWVRFDVGDAVIYTEDVDLQIGDNDIINFGDGNDVAFSWDATNLNIVPATDNTGQILIGNGTKDIDVKIFMNTTSEFVLFDVSVPTVDFGADGKGVDLRLYGETSGSYAMWDQSADQLILSGNATVAITNTRTITAEEHIVDIASTATVSSGDSPVALNVVLTATGSAASWASAAYFKTVQASKAVNGYLCAAEFELQSTAANASDNAVVVLNSSRNHTGSPPACDPYIMLREYGTTYGNVFLRIFGDTGQGAITGGASSTLLATGSADKAATCMVRCMFGSTVFWLLGTTNAPS